MTVSVWVPVVVALIAAVPVIYSVRTSRKDTTTAQTSREIELVVTGLTALVNEIQEERNHYRAALELCQEEIRRTRIMR